MMRQRASISLAVLFGVALAVYGLWRLTDPKGETGSLAATERTENTGTVESDTPSPHSPAPRTYRRQSPAPIDGDAATPSDFAGIQVPLPHDVDKGDHRNRLVAEIEANPPPLRTPGDPELDADTAYRIYLYLEGCSREPRTQRQAEEQLRQVAADAESAQQAMQSAIAAESWIAEKLESQLEGLDKLADRRLAGFYLCRNLPPDLDYPLELFTWLTEAARLGHEIAQIDYYDRALGWIGAYDDFTWAPPLFLRHPELLEEYKATARLALASAVRHGHAEAYLMMSYALLQGAIYPRDLVRALAYMRVAERKAAQHQLTLSMYPTLKNTILQNLSPAQIADAEQLARELEKEGSQ